MTPEDESFYGELKIMFASKGWKLFIQELISNYDALDTLSSAVDEKSLFINKGQLIALSNIINLEQVLKANQEMAEDDEKAEAEEDTLH
jgi:hypothetical protein